jgi:hypothetical protein
MFWRIKFGSIIIMKLKSKQQSGNFAKIKSKSKEK